MATVNALSVALFNAAAGGYAAEMTANAAGFANAVGPILEKDISTDALFVDHLLSNLGVSSTSAVYSQAKAAVAALVTTKGRAGAASDAIDFLKAQEGTTSAYATIAADFAAKVNKAAVFTAAHATERDVTVLVSAITGVDTDVLAINTAVAAQKAADDAAAAAAVAKAAADAKAAAEATAAAALKAAQDKAAADAATAKAAADKATADAAAALKAANDKATADATAAKAAADKAAADAAAALKAATDKAAADQAAALAAQKAADDAAASTAAAKAAADLKAAQDTITALQNPTGKSFALTDSTSSDVLVGSVGNDTFTGTSATYVAADLVVDGQQTDNDTYNLSVTSSNLSADSGDADALNELLPKAINIENINVTLSATSGANIYGTNLQGVKNLTVTRTDVSVGGSNIAGDKTVNIQGLDASQVAAVTAGTGTTTLTVVQATKAGVVINGNTATGAIAVTGAATLNAANGASTVAFTALSDTTEDAKSVVINAAKATGVTTAAGFTGSIEINAAAATSFDVDNATGGLLVNAAKSRTSTVGNIDDSGATLNLGTYTKTAKGDVNLDGTDALTDKASITAGGYLTLSTDADGAGTDAVEFVTLNATSALDVIFDNSSSGLKTITATGASDVTLHINAEDLPTVAFVDSTTAGTTTVSLNSNFNVANNATNDLSKIAADKIELAVDVTTDSVDTLTLATGANLVVAADQTALYVVGKTAKSVINLSTADDTAASGATIEIDLGTTLDVSSNVATLNIDASVGKLTVAKLVGASTTDVVITGSKDVTISTTTGADNVARSINASSLTGALSLETKTIKTVTSGFGDDVLTLDAATAGTVFTIETNGGDDNVTLTDIGEGTTVGTGDGADSVTIADTEAIVVVTGEGDDTVTITADTDAVINLGNGSDSLVISAANLSDNTNFACTGVEKITTAAAGTVTISAAQFANDNSFQLLGTSATADIFKVVNAGTAGTVIDASNVTFATAGQNAKLVLEGLAAKADTITGSAKVDYINATTGADIITGGAGSDTYDATNLRGASIEGTGTGTATGVVINLGSTAVTNTSILDKTDNFTANSITSVESGKTAYLFAASASTNSSVQQTIATIENLVGTAGNDYLVGNTVANDINGAAGNDYIVGGDGADTLTGGTGDDSIDLTESYSSADTVVFTGTISTLGSDKITGFVLGTDKLKFTGANIGDGNTTLTVTNAAAATAATLSELNVFTTALADDAAVIAAIQTVTSTTPTLYLVYNTADGETQVWYDANSNVDGGETQLINLGKLF